MAPVLFQRLEGGESWYGEARVPMLDGAGRRSYGV